MTIDEREALLKAQAAQVKQCVTTLRFAFRALAGALPDYIGTLDEAETVLDRLDGDEPPRPHPAPDGPAGGDVTRGA